MRSRYLVLGSLLTLAMIPYSNGCNKDLSPLNVSGTSFAQKPLCFGTTNPIGMYDDFEKSFKGFPWMPWTDGPPTGNYCCTPTWTTDSAYSCVRSCKFKFAAGDPGYWAHMAYFSSSSKSGSSGEMSFPTNSTALEMMIKVDKSVEFGFHWVEGTSSGADGEDWMTLLKLKGGDDWQKITLPLDNATFTPSSGGNHTMDVQSVSYIYLYYYDATVAYPAHTIYFDDIRFVL